MTLQFRVDADLPPKKDGAQSMWGKETEAEVRGGEVPDMSTGYHSRT